MDPLSIAAGAAGFIALAIQISEKVLNCVSTWKNAREDVHRLINYTQQLAKTFDNLDASTIDCQLSSDIVIEVKTHIQVCRTSLGNLNRELAEIRLSPWENSKPKVQIQRAKFALKASKIQKLEAICETLKSRLGLALSILIVEGNKEILKTMKNVNTGVEKVYLGVDFLKDKTVEGIGHISAGIEDIKTGVKEGQSGGAATNDLISAGIDQILAGVGQVSTSIGDVHRQVTDGYERVHVGVQDLEKQVATGLDRISTNIDGLHPLVKEQTYEIQTVVRNYHDQVMPVLSKIDEGQRNLDGRQKAQDDHDFFKWLSPLTSDFQSKQRDIYHIEARQEGIGAWLFETENFQKWFKGAPTTLWCLGNPPGLGIYEKRSKYHVSARHIARLVKLGPIADGEGEEGVGKTVLTSFIIELLQRSLQPNAAVAFLYCDYREAEKHSPSNMVGSVVHQLASQQNISAETLREFVEWNPRRDAPATLQESARLLQPVAKDISRTYLIIDALDECQTMTRDALLDELKKLDPKFHVLITSRQRNKHFDGKTHMELKVEARDKDIRRYIETRVQNPKGFEMDFRDDEALQQEIVDGISRTAKGMFLLVRLHFDLLMGALNIRNIRKALAELPPELTNTYDAMVKRITDQGKAKSEMALKTIAWICLAKRPLKVEEIQHVLAVQLGDTDFDVNGVTSKDIIIQCCGGFVGSQQDETLGFVHYTTQEYLVERSKYRHEDIAETCLTYLSFACFGNICSGTKTLRDRQENYPLFAYASSNWGHHARSGAEASVLHSALGFCKRKPNLISSCQVIYNRENNPRDTEEDYKYTFRNSCGFYSFWIAAHFGLYSLATALLEDSDTDVRRIVNCDFSPVWTAFNSSFYDIVILIIENGVDIVESYQSYELTLLHRAIISGAHEVILSILKHIGHLLRARDRDGRTILQFAIVRGKHVEDTFLLLDRSRDLEIKGFEDRTALHEASTHGNLAVVNRLLERKANIEAKDKRKRTPLHLSSSGEVTRTLVEHGADVNARTESQELPMHYAASDLNPSSLSCLLEDRRSDIEAVNAFGETALCWAASTGSLACATVLIDLGACLNVKHYDNGRRPLHQALRNEHSPVGHLLVARGADIEAQDAFGNTPLFTPDPVVTKDLLEKGARHDVRNAKGQSPLHRAASISLLATQLLLARGAETRAIDREGQAPLHTVHWHGCRRKGQDGQEEWQPLATIWTKMSKDPQPVIERMKALIDNDPGILDLKDSKGWTALQHIADGCFPEALKWLLGAGADVTTQDNQGRTSLSHCILEVKHDSAHIILEHGKASFEVADNAGKTPLHHASAARHTGIVQGLLAHGADHTAKDKRGWLPIDCAANAYSTGNKPEILKMLSEHAAAHAKPDDDNTSLNGVSGATISEVGIAEMIVEAQAYEDDLVASSNACPLPLQRQIVKPPRCFPAHAW